MEKRISPEILALPLYMGFAEPSACRAAAALSYPKPLPARWETIPTWPIDAPGQQAARSEYKATRAGYLPRLDIEQSYLAGNNPVFVFGTLLTQRRIHSSQLCPPVPEQPGSHRQPADPGDGAAEHLGFRKDPRPARTGAIGRPNGRSASRGAQAPGPAFGLQRLLRSIVGRRRAGNSTAGASFRRIDRDPGQSACR